MSAHEPEGTTTGASERESTSIVWRAIGAASPQAPPLKAGWPQQVWPDGYSTSKPSRSRTVTTANPA